MLARRTISELKRAPSSQTGKGHLQGTVKIFNQGCLHLHAFATEPKIKHSAVLLIDHQLPTIPTA